MSPAAPSPSEQPLSGGAAFVQLVDRAIQDPSRTADPRWILNSGELAPQVLCRYAAGQVTQSERAGVQELIARHDWARSRVTRLVMANRPDAPALSVGRALLTAARSGEVDPYRVAAAGALRALEAEAAAEAVESGDRAGFERLDLDGLPARLGALAFSDDPTQARADLAAHSEDAGPLVDLARRVAALDDEDEALVELLSAL